MAISKKRLIVILGMHRSGTSLITRALRCYDVALGDNLMPPLDGVNDKGFFEDLDITNLNIQMLQEIDSDWHYLTPIEHHDIELLHNKGYFLSAVDLLRKKTADYSSFCFKDPRTTKLMPFWSQVFEYCQFDTSYIIAIRNPLSVAQSLIKRDGFSLEKCYMLWLGHVLSSI